MRSVVIILFALGLVTTTMHCDESKRPLRPAALRLVDTLVAQEWRIMEVELDSQCADQYTVQYQTAYDSIMKIRVEEKNQLIRYETQ